MSLRPTKSSTSECLHAPSAAFLRPWCSEDLHGLDAQEEEGSFYLSVMSPRLTQVAVTSMHIL